MILSKSRRDFDEIFRWKVRMNGVWYDIGTFEYCDVPSRCRTKLIAIEDLFWYRMFACKKCEEMDRYAEHGIMLCPTLVFMYVHVRIDTVYYKGYEYGMEPVDEYDAKVRLQYVRFDSASGDAVLRIMGVLRDGRIVVNHYHIYRTGRPDYPDIRCNLYSYEQVVKAKEAVVKALGTIRVWECVQLHPEGYPSVRTIINAICEREVRNE